MRHYSILYDTVLYYPVLHYTILYCTILYFKKSHEPSSTHSQTTEVVKTYTDLRTELDSQLKFSGKTESIVKAAKPNIASVDKTQLF